MFGGAKLIGAARTSAALRRAGRGRRIQRPALAAIEPSCGSMAMASLEEAAGFVEPLLLGHQRVGEQLHRAQLALVRQGARGSRSLCHDDPLAARAARGRAEATERAAGRVASASRRSTASTPAPSSTRRAVSPEHQLVAIFEALVRSALFRLRSSMSATRLVDHGLRGAGGAHARAPPRRSRGRSARGSARQPAPRLSQPSASAARARSASWASAALLVALAVTEHGIGGERRAAGYAPMARKVAATSSRACAVSRVFFEAIEHRERLMRRPAKRGCERASSRDKAGSRVRSAAPHEQL